MTAGPIHLTYLSGPDVEALAMTDDEILSAVEGALAAQGRGETVIEPRVHLVPDRPSMATSTCFADRRGTPARTGDAGRSGGSRGAVNRELLPALPV